jgi:hypothetical protein
MLHVLPNCVRAIFGLDDFVSVVLQHLTGTQAHERCIVNDHHFCHQ